MQTVEGYVSTDDGIRLFFRARGNGSQVVLIPNGIYLFDDFAPVAEGRTLIFFDVRNRGRSDHVADASKIERGILHDVEDLDAVRRHFGTSHVDVIGHSYVGITVILYAMKYTAHVNRIVQIGPMQPRSGKEYPAHLRNHDAIRGHVLAGLAELEKQRPSTDAKEFCKKFWSVLRPLYVTNPVDAHKIDKWERCDLPNEANLMKYLMGPIMASIHGLTLDAEDFSKVKMPVLTVHGAKDRSAPYGGGREWALLLPNARLFSVTNGGHAPWIESPDLLESIASFLNGRWPEMAEKVTSL